MAPMAKNTPAPPNPLDASITAEEARLRARLAAGGPLLALEAEPTLRAYAQLAAALRLAVALTPATDVPAEEVAALVADQLAKDAAVLLANAEAHAAATARTARDVWSGRLNAARAQRARAQRQAAR